MTAVEAKNLKPSVVVKMYDGSEVLCHTRLSSDPRFANVWTKVMGTDVQVGQWTWDTIAWANRVGESLKA